MKINIDIRINRLFLDIHQNIIIVYPDSLDEKLLIDKPYLRNRADTHKFIIKPTSEEEFSKDDFQVNFYTELRKLYEKIELLQGYTFYILDIFKPNSTSLIQEVLLPKIKSFNNERIVLTFNPEEYNIELAFWGFKDIFGRISLFDTNDPAVPFTTEFASEYYEVKAKTKQEALEKLC